MTWLTSVLPLLGVIIGASLQFWFSRSSELRKSRQASRSQAYVDFLKAVATLAQARRNNNQPKIDEALVALIDAKSRIVVYGSLHVAQALAEFERQGARLEHEGIQAFIALCKTMRSEHESDGLHEHDISTILFALPPPKASAAAVASGSKQ